MRGWCCIDSHDGYTYVVECFLTSVGSTVYLIVLLITQKCCCFIQWCMYTQNECSNQGMFNDSRSDVPNGYFHFQPQLRKCLFFGLLLEERGLDVKNNKRRGGKAVGFHSHSLLNASTNYVRILCFNDAPCMAGDENAYVKLFSVDRTDYVSMWHRDSTSVHKTRSYGFWVTPSHKPRPETEVSKVRRTRPSPVQGHTGIRYCIRPVYPCIQTTNDKQLRIHVTYY